MLTLVTGDSHCAPLMRGFSLLKAINYPQGELDIRFCPMGSGRIYGAEFFSFKGGKLVMAEGCYSRFFPPEQVESPIGCVVLSAPLHPFRWIKSGLGGGGFKDFSVLGFNGSARPVSERLLRSAADYDNQPIRNFIQAVQGLGYKVVAIEPPRVFRDKPHLRSLAPELLVNLDRIYREQALSWMKSQSVEVIAVPDDMLDPEGFMLKRFESPKPRDQHHGSIEFGARMMQQLIAALTGMAPADIDYDLILASAPLKEKLIEASAERKRRPDIENLKARREQRMAERLRRRAARGLPTSGAE